MEVRYYSSFDRSFERLPDSIQPRVREGISHFLDYLQTRKIPQGVGLKKLKHGFWEIRIGISYRVLFRIEGGILKVVLAGTHDDIRRVFQ